MGIQGLSAKIKGACSKKNKLEDFAGLRVGVDCSVIMHMSFASIDAARQVQMLPPQPIFPAEAYFKSFIERLLTAKIIPVFVFDNVRNPAKETEDKNRKKKADAAQTNLKLKYNEQIPNAEDEYIYYQSELDKLKKAATTIPEGFVASIFDMMQELGVEAYFACMEAEHQLVQFQNQRFIDVIMSTDSDLIPLGASEMIIEWGSSVVHVCRKAALESLFGNIELLEVDIARYCAACGCDYVGKPKGLGEKQIKVMCETFRHCNDAARLAFLSDVEKSKDWPVDWGEGSCEGFGALFERAVNVFMHAPVFICND